METEKKWKFD